MTEEKPVMQTLTATGRVLKVFATDEPFKFRVTKDDVPWDPNEMVEKATKGARQ